METPHTLHIDTISGDWCDKDIVMLHACFQLLVDCVKKENLLHGHTDWNYDEDFKKAKIEIEELYKWWTERKLISSCETHDEYEKDNEMLIRLIKVRKHLWT